MATAQALLHAAARGEAEHLPALARELATSLLATDAARLAFEVLVGGPAATTKAIELARLLAQAPSPQEPNEG